MSVLALLVDHRDEVEARFTPVEIAGELTVWDAEEELYVVHEAVWDVQAACDVAESLNEHPNYAHLWDCWEEPA